ncbi:hypothetical protein [Vitreoscilla stercoraria]|uniref:Uncharacterized protein n=1 Tax=Vitreoscilla stercoraria TaxID=61 RepID=A0ABY4E9D4_VITST|nr:hypothetical protein [Vitreoscilla stercoraria]UOO92039.1 hypothetical protein LVJ81_10455 [Vitreoscilla stercoraria]
MLRSLLPLMVFCAVSVLVLIQPQMGFFIYVFTPLLLIYIGTCAWKSRHNPQLLPTLAIKMLLCFVSIASIAMIQGRHHQQARLVANEAVQSIQTYQQQHQVFPKQLQDAWQATTPLPNVSYQLDGKQAQVSYSSTFMPKTQFVYDFQNQNWRKQSF